MKLEETLWGLLAFMAFVTVVIVLIDIAQTDWTPDTVIEDYGTTNHLGWEKCMSDGESQCQTEREDYNRVCFKFLHDKCNALFDYTIVYTADLTAGYGPI